MELDRLDTKFDLAFFFFSQRHTVIKIMLLYLDVHYSDPYIPYTC